VACAGIVAYYRPSRQLEHANLSPLPTEGRWQEATVAQAGCAERARAQAAAMARPGRGRAGSP
jgi:hypothetical protein